MIDERITKIYSQVIQANVLHVLSKCCQRVVKSTNNVWETSKVRERHAFIRPDQKNRYLLPSSSGLWVNWTLINRLPDLSEDNLDNTLSLCILISFPLTTRTHPDRASKLINQSTNYLSPDPVKYTLRTLGSVFAMVIIPVDLKLTDIHDARARCVAICCHYASGPGRDIGPRLGARSSVRASAQGSEHTGGGSRGQYFSYYLTW